MAPIPKIPQAVPKITFGAPVEGTEVLNVRFDADRDSAHGVEISANGEPVEWVLGLPDAPKRASDFSEHTDFLDDGWRARGAQVIRHMNQVVAGHPVRAKRHLIQLHLPANIKPRQLRSLIIGAIVGGHEFVTTNEKRPGAVRSLHLAWDNPAQRNIDNRTNLGLRRAVRDGVQLGKATCLSRDLANAPSNVKSPEWLARRAKKLVGNIPGVKVKIRDAEWLRNKGFGGIIAVGSGSSRPPVMVEMVWDPESIGLPQRRSPIAMVGKGVTFDTGGISIKPAAGMDLMRTDMTGGASVIAAFRALAEGQVPRKVVAIVPMAENMVSGDAYRPGDVVEHYGGITSEVTNTDAEGRMVLADAISYVAKKYEPNAIISIATLTGAAKLALGLRTGAVFAPTPQVALKLARRGAQVGEQWWPLPQPKYLEQAVDSKIADVRQAPKGPGATTAAMFLRRFTRGVDLIHLDIAGPGRAEQTYAEVSPVGTGFGARTLVQWLAK